MQPEIVFLFLLPALLAASACAPNVLSGAPLSRIDQMRAAPPGPASFQYCLGHGCRSAADTGLSDGEWAELRGLFTSAAGNPERERELTAVAVGKFEAFVGARTGTSADRGGTFPGYGRDGQLDCVDEAINTTLLLSLLSAKKLLHWHSVGGPASRGAFIDNEWPHATATIAELPGERSFTVHSWFFDDGGNAVVVPLEQWFTGWTTWSDS